MTTTKTDSNKPSQAKTQQNIAHKKEELYTQKTLSARTMSMLVSAYIN